MSTKAKVIIVSISLLSSFALGRYTTPTKTITVTKIVKVRRKAVDKKIDTKKNIHKKTTTTVIVRPDGTTETTTVVTDDSIVDKKSDDKTVVDSSTKTDSKTEIVKGEDKVTISALGGYDLNLERPVFGVSITRPVLGPFTLGVFVLTSPTVGASVGLTF